MNIRNDNEHKTNWCFDEKLNGYIYVSQLKNINEFTPVPKSNRDEFLTGLKNSDVHIIVKSKAFNVKEHKIARDKNREIYNIDGVNTAQSPFFEYDYVKIQFKNKPTFFLPKSALAGLYELSPSSPEISAYYDKNNDKLFIHGSISDASDVAEFVWVIKNKQYTERGIYLGYFLFYWTHHKNRSCNCPYKSNRKIKIFCEFNCD